MKRILFGLVIAVLLSTTASAQFTGHLSTAETVLKSQSNAGGFVGIYEDGLGVVGQYRRGIGGYSDFGIKLGIVDFDAQDGNGMVIALDTKYQIMEVRIQDPVDLSVGGKIEFGLFEHYNIMSFGGFLTGSHPILLRSGRAVTPYGMVILRVDRVDHDEFDSDSDFKIALTLGSKLELSSSSSVYTEFHLDEMFAFFMGVEFGL